MSNIIEIGNTRAKPGTIAQGEIIVEKLAGGGSISIPVTIINGIKEGPCFWVNGGIHGDEPEGILTCSLLKKSINPQKLSGSVILTPVINVPAMEAAERGNPLDTFSYDMNRIYPGREDGYLSERIANIHKEWMVKFADMEISIHSGGSHSYLAEAMFAATDEKTQELARAMGEDWKVCLYSNVTSKSPMAVMSENGKPALTVELGGRSATAPGKFLEVGNKLHKACINIMTHFKMIDGNPHYPSVRYKGYQQALLAPKSGIFLPNPKINFLTMMKKNDLIATIINYHGEDICKIMAPQDGMIFGLRALPNVTIGEWCCFYAIIEGEW